MLVPGLYQFFHRHVEQGFGELGLREAHTVDYVSDLLTRFAHTHALYLVRNPDDQPVETIAGLMLEWRRSQGDDDAPADRPREVMVIRHIGDYSLFMTGLFRDRLRRRGQLNYYLTHGRSAFWRCAGFESHPRRVHTYHQLYHDFERIAGALDRIWQRRLPLDQTAGVSPLAAVWRN